MKPAKPIKDAGPTTTLIPISDLSADPANVRSHNDRNKEAISASLKRFGAARSIVVDGKDVVRAGSGTLEQARKLGYERVLVVDSDGKTLIAVRRKDWTPGEAAMYGVSDNRAAELAGWDNEALSGLMRAMKIEGHDILGLGFQEHELEPLLQAEWKPPAVGDMPALSAAQHAYHVTDEQREIIDQAIATVKKSEGSDDISNGRALELICADYLAGKSS